ncbi:hypothetical protein PWYN_17860 [Paenibacillus wynnii]|uniref:Uncharacterized protein n=1 Tax=Paenibacillus wynnii TaxID=268407 RepID=A0A098M2K1_9BACL|nr:hypothetical protein PWYN_17860 [Paenibacillus wynnii]
MTKECQIHSELEKLELKIKQVSKLITKVEETRGVRSETEIGKEIKQFCTIRDNALLKVTLI